MGTPQLTSIAVAGPGPGAGARTSRVWSGRHPLGPAEVVVASVENSRVWC